VDWSGDPVGDPLSASALLAMDAAKVVIANFATWTTRLVGRGTPGTATAVPRIDLTWLAPGSGADHYNVFRSSTSAGAQTLVGTAATPAFADRTTGLVNGGIYY
jgi:hypothetical protein